MKETRHDKRLAHLWAIFISLSLAAALTLTKGAVAAPEGGVSALVTATPITSVFRPTVTVTPVGGTVPLPQEVRGAVVDRQGRGVTGALVRVSSPGWYADTPSGGGGGFVFTLGKGEFSIQLTDRPSEPAFIVVTGDTRIYVEFREILLSEPTATPTPTPSATPTPHPTLTPESTPVPLLTPTPLPPLTPPPDYGPPVRIDIPTPATTATPTLGPSLLSFPEISLDFLVTPLLAGIGVAAFVFVVGLGIFLLRR